MLACTADPTENLTNHQSAAQCSFVSFEFSSVNFQLVAQQIQGYDLELVINIRVGLCHCVYYALPVALLKDRFILFQVHLNVCCNHSFSPYWL